jgi:two-component system, sensor histidine kinase and response regulator
VKHSILVVDDEADNVDALERLFRRKYKVFKATSADEGLAIIEENNSGSDKISLIISDQRMPKKTGVEFLEESQDILPDAIRILLTGFTDIDSVISAINSGQVYRYITKPWDPVDLANTIDKAIERYEMGAELKEKNAALASALAELKVLDEAKSNFMILINHELKTPLTVILSFLELLKESDPNAEQQKYISRISMSADKLKRIVDDVLLFVQADSGALKVSKKKISIEKAFEEAKSRYASQLSAKNQTVKMNESDFSVKADSKVLNEVLGRLFDNAIKFGGEDAILEVSAYDAGNDRVEISVTNPGKAIPAKTIDKILKPFTLDEDIMKHSEGLGLGLSLTQALLKTHESELKLECPKGHVRASFTLEMG